ncbi:hypothetical protein BCR42DRAFT_416138 [Absidia repens]|uniref:F-box domain-containing protein n=1 Tax=Absidia repens TaxID=90262 RepID=A0A1X2IG57_9FUNG|nr:hypothetical protein BCR42DRAFT_416138 [Absidia repens]
MLAYIDNNLLFDDKILARLCYYLSIRDIVILAQTCQKLQLLIFNDGELWKERNLIFRPQDKQWLRKPIIQRLISRIPRHHELRTLKIHDLPTLDTMTLFFILDHCAHSLNHLDLMMSFSQCHQLCTHLEAFCFHLATSQAWNKIPLTLHQYTLDSNQLYQQAQTILSPSSQPFFIHQLISHGLPTKMDDPPFEMLEHLTVTISPEEPPTSDDHHFFSGDTSSSISSTMLIKKFHHLIELLSLDSPTLTFSSLTTTIPSQTGSPGKDGGGAIVRNPIIPTPAFFQTPPSPPPSLSVSSGGGSLSSSSSTIIHIADMINKRPSPLKEQVTDSKKRKKQQAEAKRKQDYYDRIHQLSHQCRPRSLSNSPPPSPSTPPPHRADTFISPPPSRRHHHHTTAPIVHVMRCHRPQMKK